MKPAALVAALAIGAAGACGKQAADQHRAEPEPAAHARPVDPPQPTNPTPAPAVDPDQRAFDDMTAGAIDGHQLVGYAPPTLGGVARSNVLDQAFAVAAAYQLADGGYANLDLKNTFHRGSHDTAIEDGAAQTCPKHERIAGADACIRVLADRASIHWYLPDRLTVDLSAPDEKRVRAMARDLPIAKLAELSAAK